MLGTSSVVYRLPSGPALAAGHLPTVLSIASPAGAQILCGGLDAECGAARARDAGRDQVTHEGGGGGRGGEEQQQVEEEEEEEEAEG